MSRLPTAFVLSKFLVYSYEPSLRKGDGIYNAGCPICKEGKSLGKKKRLFYYPNSNSFYCWNCSRGWTAQTWLERVTGLSKEEIEAEALSGNYSTDLTSSIFKEEIKTKKKLPSLPRDSINLSDPLQQKYWGNHSIIEEALEYIHHRRLDRAINKAENYYLSLNDYFHANRLVIPYLNWDKQIIFYQTRALDNSEPRYLNKVGYDKSLFGIERISQELDYIFITEGPCDASFIRNGTAAAGLILTKTQKDQLSRFPLMKKVWILDNPRFDNNLGSVKKKLGELLSQKQLVFNWPKYWNYKDLNEMAIKQELNEIPTEEILKNLY